MTQSPAKLGSPGAPPEASSNQISPPAPSSPKESPTSTREPPRLLLEGSDLAAAGGEPLQQDAEDEEETERRRKLDKLRAQLQRSELNRSPHGSQHRVNDADRNGNIPEDSTETRPDTPSESPEALKSSQRSRRRVQWVGLTADDEFRESRSPFPRTVIIASAIDRLLAATNCR